MKTRFQDTDMTATTSEDNGFSVHILAKNNKSKEITLADIDKLINEKSDEIKKHITKIVDILFWCLISTCIFLIILKFIIYLGSK